MACERPASRKAFGCLQKDTPWWWKVSECQPDPWIKCLSCQQLLGTCKLAAVLTLGLHHALLNFLFTTANKWQINVLFGNHIHKWCAKNGTNRNCHTRQQFWTIPATLAQMVCHCSSQLVITAHLRLRVWAENGRRTVTTGSPMILYWEIFLSRITGTIDHDLFPAIPRKSSIWSQTPKSSQQKRNDSTAGGSLVQPPTAKVPLCACWISSTILCKLPNLPEHLLNLLCWASVCWHTSGHYCRTCLHTRFRGSTCTEKTWQIFVLFQNTMR